MNLSHRFAGINTDHRKGLPRVFSDPSYLCLPVANNLSDDPGFILLANQSLKNTECLAHLFVGIEKVRRDPQANTRS